MSNNNNLPAKRPLHLIRETVRSLSMSALAVGTDHEKKDTNDVNATCTCGTQLRPCMPR